MHMGVVEKGLNVQQKLGSNSHDRFAYNRGISTRFLANSGLYIGVISISISLVLNIGTRRSNIERAYGMEKIILR